jgi:adenylosuccinate synthase
VTEDAALTRALPDASNAFGAWQQGFRVGWLDMLMLKYALEATGPLDQLAVTCLDRLAELPDLRICRRYRHDTFDIDRIACSPAPRDLEYQERITNRLARCTPVLETLESPSALLQFVEHELGVPIGIISEGPAAEDKHRENSHQGAKAPRSV